MCAKNESNHKRSFFFIPVLLPFVYFFFFSRMSYQEIVLFQHLVQELLESVSFFSRVLLAIILAPATIGATGIVPPRCLFLRLRAMIFQNIKNNFFDLFIYFFVTCL